MKIELSLVSECLYSIKDSYTITCASCAVRRDLVGFEHLNKPHWTYHVELDTVLIHAWLLIEMPEENLELLKSKMQKHMPEKPQEEWEPEEIDLLVHHLDRFVGEMMGKTNSKNGGQYRTTGKSPLLAAP